MSGSTARKKAPKKNVSKEALKVTALKKREVTIRAMAIIEKMIEEKVEEKWLLDSVHSITQDQYQDVIEERAITKLCGYPLCCDVLKDIPSKTFHISTKQNKVYDITDRKNFCSNGCYKASSYLKNQVLSSPLWLRDAEERPDYNILHFKEGGSLGAEVDLGHQRVRLSDINAPASNETNNDTNISSEKSDESPQNQNLRHSTEKSKKVQLEAEDKVYQTLPQRVPFSKRTNENINEKEISARKSPEPAEIKSVNISVGERDSVGVVLDEKLCISPQKEIDDLNETTAEVKIPDEVKSASNKLGSLETTVEVDKSTTLVNQKPRELKTSLNLSCSTKNSSDIIANSETCSVVSNEKITRTSHKDKSDSIVGEIKSFKVQSENESDLVSCELRSLKAQSENESASEVTKNESDLVSLESESLKKPSKTKAINPVSKNASGSRSADKTTAELPNKFDSSSNPGKVSVATTQNESSEPVEKITEHSSVSESKLISSQESDSKPLKAEPNSKKQSVFKKERHKTKRHEDKVDQKAVLLEVVKHIEKCLREWITFDSLIFLFGEESVKKTLEAKGTEFKDCKSLCGTDASTYEKYLSICRKLNMLELEDARADAALKEKNADLRPLPDYSLLKREAKQLEIKVRSFYEGSTRIEIEEDVVKESKEEDDSNVVLPLVDMHAQKALRRRIVLDRLNVILPDLGRTLNLSIFNLTSAVRNLSQTFSFSSHNITFKPPEWYFIAMVLVKLLSLQDKNMKIMMESGSSEKYLTLLLMNWGLDGGYLDRLVSWLTDIDYLLQKSS